jgi:hypothetical protein
MNSDKGRPRRRPHDWDDGEDEVQDMPPVPMRRRRPPLPPVTRAPSAPRPRPRQYASERPRVARQELPKRRSVWPWLLMGCAGGIVLLVLAAAAVVFFALRGATGSTGVSNLPLPGMSTSVYTQKSSPQQIPLPTLQQVQVHDQIGNVMIAVDPSTTTPTVAYVKKVKAASSDAANKEFNNIVVQVQPSGTPDATLSVNATVPDNGTLFSNHTDSVDIMVTLPPQSISAPVTPTVGSITATVTSSTASTPLKLDVNVSIGNISVTGLSGILQIQDNIGNITVQQATLSDGSSLRTSSGNVTFNGKIDTTSLASNSQPIYTIQSETGNLDVTLPADTNVILDAYTNNGTIASDFDVSKIKDSDGSLHGPLVSGTSPTALLKLHVSTGNVRLRKSA